MDRAEEAMTKGLRGAIEKIWALEDDWQGLIVAVAIVASIQLYSLGAPW